MCKLILDRMLNSNGESWQDDTRNRKLQPVAIKILHPGIKQQLRCGVTARQLILVKKNFIDLTISGLF